jgi:hypothetical protein
MKTKNSRRSGVAAALPLLLVLPIVASADEGAERVKTHLVGFQEVPVIASTGTAVFRAKIAENDLSFQWELTYSGLTAVTQAHIHMGQRSVNGAIVIWLCGNVETKPPGVQPCPASAGTVSGTATAAQVVAVPAQGITARDFADVLNAIRSGVAYANVHTAAHPGGEIRGQLNDHDDGH